MKRRRLLARGFALAPLAAALLSAAQLSACGDDDGWPEGMLPIKWDRDTCARCSMAISDRRFAVQVRGGPKRAAFKFDDIGCATTWCAEKHQDHPWAHDSATHWWVAEYGSPGPRWLDARRAHYVGGRTSPMGYNLAAVGAPQAGSLDFAAMHAQTASAWPANCLAGASAPRGGTAASAP